MTIDVIIPNYNGFALLKENLLKVIESVKQYKGSIIIVDDCSENKEFESLADFIKKLDNKSIILLRNEKNLGFSSTVNRGVAESNANFVVLLNTDVVPEKNFLEAALSDLEENKNLFGVGMMDQSIEGGKTILRGRGLASWKKGFLQHRRGEVDNSDTFWVSGGSSVIRRELFVKLGGLDTLYDPFYWEDIDLSYRARKSGYELRFERKSVVEHRHLEGSIKKHYNNFQIKTIAYRNQLIFVWKNITDMNLIASHLLWLPYHILTSILRFDISMSLGLILALVRFPAIIGKRSEQKKFYKIGDSALLKI